MSPVRYDAEEVRAYVAAHSADLPKRLLEVAVLYWRRRLSASEAAAELGIKKDRVWELVKQLRSLVHPRGVPRAGSAPAVGSRAMSRRGFTCVKFPAPRAPSCQPSPDGATP
jgi:hypothetical protein